MPDAGLLTIGGGVAGMLAFVTAMMQILFLTQTWRDLIKEVRSELRDCRDEREAERLSRQKERSDWEVERRVHDQKLTTLEGEVTLLRQQVHTDRKLGRGAIPATDEPRRQT